MRELPLVSIIVPVYNVEQYLTTCLDSLINQTYRNIEIICVNDGSPDRSIDILNSYALSDSRVKVVSKSNGGISDARNYGIKYASGKYFMFIDSDDWLDSCACEKTVYAAEANGADCVMFAYTKEFGNTHVPVQIFKNYELNNPNIGFKQIVEGHLIENTDIRDYILLKTFGPTSTQLCKPQECDITVSACMQLFKSNLFKDIKFYDIRKLGTFEDGVYQIDVYSRCKRFIYIDVPWYHYRKTNASSITSKYNPDLHIRWKGLFNLLYEKSAKYANDEEERKSFENAINNRIALSILPLGLNVVRADISFKSKRNILKSILKDEVYAHSLKSLPMQYLALPWKFIFTLAKYKRSFSLASCFSAIEYLRTHAQK